MAEAWRRLGAASELRVLPRFVAADRATLASQGLGGR